MNSLKLVLLIVFGVSVISLFGRHPEKYVANYAHGPRFKALIYYDPMAEKAHVQFDKQALNFFRKLNYGDGFVLDTVTSLVGYSYEKLSEYSIVIMLNAVPKEPEERDAFEKYMENGGGWLGFHASGYNDQNTHWTWYNDFLGCGQFYCNNWPPQPVLVISDTQKHPVTHSLPKSFVIPSSEFYQWKPNPRKNKNVKVLLSISTKNYPLGIKDVVEHGDFPLVWTNKRYRMVYLNMGHGDEEFMDVTQNLLFVNAFRWVVSKQKKGDPFKK